MATSIAGNRASAIRKPNLLLIVTDDQPWFSMRYMTKTLELMRERGMEFRNARVCTPSCSPSRTSLLTGLYAHNHGVLNNVGAAKRFRALNLESRTMARKLRDAGYRTGLFGKFLNSYEDIPKYTPSGWSQWVAVLANRDPAEANINGEVGVVHQDGHEVAIEHETDWLANRASGFIEHGANARPWFCYAAIKAPHYPYRPSPRHKHDFDREPLYRSPNFNEEDVSDKPSSARDPLLSDDDVVKLRQEWRGKLEELLDVDDAVQKLFRALGRTGQLDNTYVFYCTDNGHLLGAHRMHSKGEPYEEAVKTPLFARGPGIQAGTSRNHLVGNLDLFATCLDLAGLPHDDVDGRSLVPLFSAEAPWRKRFLIEHPLRKWAAFATQQHVYVERRDGKELYDLATDPYQLENAYLAADPALKDALARQLAALNNCKRVGCRRAENQTP